MGIKKLNGHIFFKLAHLSIVGACDILVSELSETQNYAYWYACFFPGTHDFRKAGVPRTHVF